MVVHYRQISWTVVRTTLNYRPPGRGPNYRGSALPSRVWDAVVRGHSTSVNRFPKIKEESTPVDKGDLQTDQTISSFVMTACRAGVPERSK